MPASGPPDEPPEELPDELPEEELPEDDMPDELPDDEPPEDEAPEELVEDPPEELPDAELPVELPDELLPEELPEELPDELPVEPDCASWRAPPLEPPPSSPAVREPLSPPQPMDVREIAPARRAVRTRAARAKRMDGLPRVRWYRRIEAPG
jgi:hypothetical protein